MACSLKSVFYVPKLNDTMLLGTKSKGVLRLCPSRHVEAKSSTYSILSTDFIGKPIVLSEVNGSKYYNLKTSRDVSINVCKSFVFFIFFVFCYLLIVLLYVIFFSYTLILRFYFRHMQQVVLANH
jgi:hypothetical protein